ncbi:MAG: decarboxylating NADP(+)-dependent phosphogluconate dehydrogenase [Bacillota bacterium]|nr:decarboxylating NADP(+)-dependent phosphogluconate dehydrogenase [Bacillota bacterium]
MANSNIGMVGLAVMGSNLARNMASHGFKVSCWNYTPDLTDKFFNGAAKGNDNLVPFYDLKEFVDSLEKPRRIFMLIMAGSPVDSMIEQLLPLLDEGDIIVDGGNSHYPDTIRRYEYCKEHGINFVGCGVSGGEEGALHGPSLMPGGSKKAWEALKPILQTICAHTDNGEPCCDYVGDSGAGHFVKMVHNGIEYGDMELICETYNLLKNGLGLSNDEMRDIFKEWNEGELNSFLIEITSNILGYKDENGEYVVDTILDKAGQKGTGKWTGIEALDEGVPLTLIVDAVFGRCLSSMKDERVKAAKEYNKKVVKYEGDKAELIENIRRALYVSKIISYAQGYQLFHKATETFGWELNNGGIALMWRGGCIIRSKFLGKIKEAFDKNPNLENLLLDDYFKNIMIEYVPALREVVKAAVDTGIAASSFFSALSYFDGFTSEKLPANMIQAQRDYFGAHTYEVIGKEGHFHTNWTGEGGDISSTAYNR